MKVKIHKVTIPVDASLSLTDEQEVFEYYTVEYKGHWWQKSKFVLDPQTHVPRLFKSMYEISCFFYSIGMEDIFCK